MPTTIPAKPSANELKLKEENKTRTLCALGIMFGTLAVIIGLFMYSVIAGLVLGGLIITVLSLVAGVQTHRDIEEIKKEIESERKE